MLALPGYLLLAGMGAWLAIADARTHRLPNRALPVTALGFSGWLLAVTVLTGAWEQGVAALAGGLGLFLANLVLAVAAPAGLGMGDVKLAGVLGVALGWLGWPALVVGAGAAFALGATAGGWLLAGPLAIT